MTPEQILEKHWKKHLSSKGAKYEPMSAKDTEFICAAMEEYAGNKLLERYPDITFAYSTRQLQMQDNFKCTCKLPDGVARGGYCYAKNEKGETVRPCDMGISVDDIKNNANIKG